MINESIVDFTGSMVGAAGTAGRVQALLRAGQQQRALLTLVL